ncbi:MAG: hypothetical protein AB7K63_21145 [Vicinamibacterales bacterium]
MLPHQMRQHPPPVVDLARSQWRVPRGGRRQRIEHREPIRQMGRPTALALGPVALEAQRVVPAGADQSPVLIQGPVVLALVAETAAPA